MRMAASTAKSFSRKVSRIALLRAWWRTCPPRFGWRCESVALSISATIPYLRGIMPAQRRPLQHIMQDGLTWLQPLIRLCQSLPEAAMESLVTGYPSLAARPAASHRNNIQKASWMRKRKATRDVHAAFCPGLLCSRSHPGSASRRNLWLAEKIEG